MEICLNPDHPYRTHLIVDKKRHKHGKSKERNAAAKAAKDKDKAKDKSKHAEKALQEFIFTGPPSASAVGTHHPLPIIANAGMFGQAHARASISSAPSTLDKRPEYAPRISVRKGANHIAPATSSASINSNDSDRSAGAVGPSNAGVDGPPSDLPQHAPIQIDPITGMPMPRKSQAKGTRSFQKLTSFFGETVPTAPPPKLANFFGEQNLSRKERKNSTRRMSARPSISSVYSGVGVPSDLPPPIPKRVSKVPTIGGIIGSSGDDEIGENGAPVRSSKKLEHFFGDRPPSQLIVENLEEFFPGISQLRSRHRAIPGRAEQAALGAAAIADANAALATSAPASGAPAPAATVATTSLSPIPALAVIPADVGETAAVGELARLPDGTLTPGASLDLLATADGTSVDGVDAESAGKSLPAVIKEAVTNKRTSRILLQKQHLQAMARKLLSSNMELNASATRQTHVIIEGVEDDAAAAATRKSLEDEWKVKVERAEEDAVLSDLLTPSLPEGGGGSDGEIEPGVLPGNRARRRSKSGAHSIGAGHPYPLDRSHGSVSSSGSGRRISSDVRPESAAGMVSDDDHAGSLHRRSVSRSRSFGSISDKLRGQLPATTTSPSPGAGLDPAAHGDSSARKSMEVAVSSVRVSMAAVCPRADLLLASTARLAAVSLLARALSMDASDALASAPRAMSASMPNPIRM
ncbi:hypothetical protein BC831DRAFT_108887 [Entophlyctis helioformis]|nr:hypothetical protein BC831DRAFT_108887 [Entophlyctis helioformis]